MIDLMSPSTQVDKTLTQDGMAADAKAVGDALSTAYGLTTRLCKQYSTNGGNFKIRFTTTSGERTYFTIFVIDQGNNFAGIAVTLNVHANQFACNTFLNNSLAVKSSSMTVGDPSTINITLNNNSAWGHVWVFPSDDVTSIS